MCRESINACVLCTIAIRSVLPYLDRTTTSPTITLFRPTECVNKQAYTFTYHPEYLDNA